MFGNNFYNPYMYQPYYQTANMARGLGRAAAANTLSRAGSGLASASSLRNMGNIATLGNTTGGLAGIGKGLFSKFSFTDFLNGASKTLNVVNQAIPIFYQVKPMINNAKTMFRVMSAVKDDDPPSRNNTITMQNNTQVNTVSTNYSSQRLVKSAPINESDTVAENPVFFI